MTQVMVAGVGQPAILWGDVEERCVQMDLGRTGRRDFGIAGGQG